MSAPLSQHGDPGPGPADLQPDLDDVDDLDDEESSPAASDGSDEGDDDQQGRSPSPANAEAARYRTQLRAAQADVAVLSERLDRYVRADAERAAADVLAQPADLWLFADPIDVLDDDGEVDPERVRQVAQQVAQERPGLAVPARDIGQGRRGAPAAASGGWAGVLRNSQGTSSRFGAAG